MLQIILVPGLVQRVQDEIEAQMIPVSLETGEKQVMFPYQAIFRLPLLSSIYAEALRLHVKVFFFASSPRSDLYVSRWFLPRGTLGVVSTDGPHMDERVWNTQDGRHPVDTFWAERFLVDPSDPSSGPVKPEFRSQSGEKKRQAADATSKYFSTDGLEGSWLPYGGNVPPPPPPRLSCHSLF